MIEAIKLNDLMKRIRMPWSPLDVATVNDQVVRMALLDGEFHWHKHKNEDELFYVLRGHIVIQLKDRREVELREGELTVIPKDVEHCPKSVKPSYCLLFEPRALNTRGD
jgi:mannose-6-phosphate isomerase-like protein (cupin superfamily)